MKSPCISDALVQFAGEVIRLNAMLDQIEAARVEENREILLSIKRGEIEPQFA